MIEEKRKCEICDAELEKEEQIYCSECNWSGEDLTSFDEEETEK